MAKKKDLSNYPMVRPGVFTFRPGDCAYLHGYKYVGDCEVVETMYEPPMDVSQLGKSWKPESPFPQVIVTMDEKGDTYPMGQRVILTGAELQDGMLMFTASQRGKGLNRLTYSERRTVRMRNLIIQAMVNSHIGRNSNIYFEEKSDWKVFNNMVARVMVFDEATNIFVYGNGVYRIMGSGHTYTDEFHVEYLKPYDAELAKLIGYTTSPKEARGISAELLTHFGVTGAKPKPVPAG
jgi:hypothetical protein